MRTRAFAPACLCLSLALPSAAEATERFLDPFAYCAAVGDADAPAAPYDGPALPQAVLEATVSLGLVSADAPSEFREHTAWRCMDGKVWLCSFGANIPCDARARTSREPTPGMARFCEEHPGEAAIPAYAAGRDTLYAWRCDGSAPVLLREVMKADSRGFLAGFWHEVPAPAP